MAKQTNTPLEWFLGGTAAMGFVWLYSSDWPYALHLLTSWPVWAAIGFMGLMRAFGSTLLHGPPAQWLG